MAKEKKPMRDEYIIFGALPLFFTPVAIVYALVTDAEPIGTITLLGLAGMFAFFGGYLWLTSRRVDLRPSDVEDGEIAEGQGEFGEFNASSWWPLAAGVAVTIVFAGLAIGWWFFGIGVAFGVIALIGYAFENNRGIYAH